MLHLRAWLSAFLFTQAIEVPIDTYALGAARRRPLWARAAIGFGASAITHPIVWFVIPRFAPGGYWSMVAQAEAFAVLVEAAYLYAFGLPDALLWSIVANGASAGLGMLFRATFGWP